jgi:flagellar assembly protein FliH
MAKAVFRQGEIVAVPDKLIINSPILELKPVKVPSEEEEELEPEVEKYTGPTAEDLRREADEFKVQWEAEKQEMLQAAKDEAENIVHAANFASERERELTADEVSAQKARAKEDAEFTVAEAKRQAQEIVATTRTTMENERKEALEQGREAGRSEGFTEGMAEVERLVQRTRTVLERAQDKRGEILSETEREIIDLVLLMTRKVVKVISETQREVVVSNVVQALRKVRDRCNILIRVNLTDLKLTTEHTAQFIKLLEGVKSIQVIEDSTVDAGGCIIETDFGEVDARISNQLAELETKILGISPIKSKVKPPSTPNVRNTVNS